jgi:two-component system cell cycle response regulator
MRSLAPFDVLLVDAEREHARTISAWLEAARLDAFRITQADSIAAALRCLVAGKFDVVLLDLMLPDVPGLAAVTELRRAAPELPVLVLSRLDDERLALEAVLNGAQDYLIKGQSDAGLVRRSIRHAIERQRVERELNQLATHDPLTGLPNRTLFHDRLTQALRRLDRPEVPDRTGELVTVIFLDLDGFKAVNDRYGHPAGDRLLAAVAKRLVRAVRRTDTVARLGGDEFTILLEGLHRQAEAARIAEKVLASLRQPFELGGFVVALGASLGIAIAAQPGQAPDRLTREADAAMYRAKAAGGTGYRFHCPRRHRIDWRERLSV